MSWDKDLAQRADKIIATERKMGSVSGRNPYVPEMKRSWFMENNEYRFYMLREGAGVIVGFFVFDLIVGLVCLNRGLESWQWWVDLQRNPLLMLLAALALVTSLIHTITWFQLVPKIIRVQRGTKFVSDGVIAAVSAVLLFVFAAIMVIWLA